MIIMLLVRLLVLVQLTRHTTTNTLHTVLHKGKGRIAHFASTLPPKCEEGARAANREPQFWRPQGPPVGRCSACGATGGGRAWRMRSLERACDVWGTAEAVLRASAEHASAASRKMRWWCGALLSRQRVDHTRTRGPAVALVVRAARQDERCRGGH